MERLLEKCRESLDETLIKITVSNPRKAEEIRKFTLRPVLLKGRLVFQMERFTKTQAFQENLDREQTMEKLAGLLPLYKQVQVQTRAGDWTALINKKGQASFRTAPERIRISQQTPAWRSKADGRASSGELSFSGDLSSSGDLSLSCGRTLSHNRPKRHIFREGMQIPFLCDLGVMTSDWQVRRSKYAKFRQINRFLEFIEDVLPHLPRDRQMTILDFGCGKSYLTFAVYYYLREMQGYDLRIIGLDLKKEVIADCNRLAQRYGFDRLKFYEGSIEEYEGVSRADMVITLHACDTATDYALVKAINWGAKVILSVPCCQHELNGQMAYDALWPITDYGILKERFAAMATDAIRAECLKEAGYETQILEFIAMEHTAKNLLIRAVKKEKAGTPETGRPGEKQEQILEFCRSFGVAPTMVALLEKERERNR